jgi:hypothetical protein
MRRTAVNLALLLASGGAFACEPPNLSGAARVESARHVVAFRLAPAALPLNAPFTVEFTACAKDGAVPPTAKLDAWMPAHRHGMNYRPKLTVIAPGQFRAEGLLFHMPGRWELLFELGGDRIAAPQELK